MLPSPSPVSIVLPNGGLGGDLLVHPLLSSLRLHRRVSCKAKITNMSNHVIIQENIAWLEITVNNWQWSVLVKIIKCRSHINGKAEPSGSNYQGLSFSQETLEFLPTSCCVKDQVFEGL